MKVSRVELLKQVPLFQQLDTDFLEDVASCARIRTFPPNEALFHEGDPGHTLYIILSGRIRIERPMPTGTLLFVAHRGPGDQVGELSLIDGRPRMADAVTAETSELMMLDRTDFMRCLEQSPRLALGIIISLAQRLRQAAVQLESRQDRDVLSRVSEVLLELADRSGTRDPYGPIRITANVTQQQIADQVGATRETVNRALNTLKNLGVLHTEGRRIVVERVDRLRRYAIQT